MNRENKPPRPKLKPKPNWKTPSLPPIRSRSVQPQYSSYDDNELTYEERGFSSHEEMMEYLAELDAHHDPNSPFELDIGGQS